VAEPLALTNPLTQLLDKERSDFTRADMLRVLKEKNIERLTFHYTSLDGKLRELKLPVSDQAQAERVLASGERVDGSSLFPGLVDTASSDLYVVPSYATAFLSPFESASLNFICRFLDRDGQLAPFTPDNILTIAHQRFRKRTSSWSARVAPKTSRRFARPVTTHRHPSSRAATSSTRWSGI